MSARILVDTHAVLWALGDPERLSAPGRGALEHEAAEAFVSTASIWEIAIKQRHGKLRAPDALLEAVEATGFTWLPVREHHAWRTRDLPLHHRDPFDRLLIAQALEEHLDVVTADGRFAAYGLRTIW